MRENWNKTPNDSQRVTQNVEYEKGFSPLLGISFSWKGSVSTDVNYNLTQSVSDQRIGNRKTKTNAREFRIRASYSSRKGIKIPIPVWPFKNKRLKNQTTFSLTYENRFNKSVSSAENAKFNDKDPDRLESSWSIRPNIDYQFSNTVTGSFHYEYAMQESQIRGKTTSQDFGFEVRISIRG
jgi:cell surface protein SprA